MTQQPEAIELANRRFAVEQAIKAAKPGEDLTDTEARRDSMFSFLSDGPDVPHIETGFQINE